MPTVTLVCPGAVRGGGVFDPGPGAPAGTWNDGSDDTWAVGDSECDLEVVPRPRPFPNLAFVTVTAHARYSGPEPGRVAVNDSSGSPTILGLRSFPGGATEVPTWTSVELTPDPQLEGFLERVFLGDFGGATLIILGHDATRIYEAHMTVSWPGGAAGSVRNFPADTSNSVGGPVRQFPPSTSTARSSRFAGGYG